MRVDREQRRGWRKWRWNVHWPEWDLGCHPDQSQLAVTYEQKTHTKKGGDKEGGEKKKEYITRGHYIMQCITEKQQKDRCEQKHEGHPCCSLLRRDGHECRCGWCFRRPRLGSNLKTQNKPWHRCIPHTQNEDRVFNESKWKELKNPTTFCWREKKPNLKIVFQTLAAFKGERRKKKKQISMWNAALCSERRCYSTDGSERS